MLVTMNLAAQIYQNLRHDLMAGRYEPGQKLKLRDLAAEMGVSVTPVREALARLVSEHAVVQLDRRSVFVPIMDDERFTEIRDLRLELEGRGAELAAGCARPTDIAALEAIHDRLLDARTREYHADILLQNEEFHLTLCLIANQPMLLRLIELLWLQCGPLMHGMTRWPVIQPHPHPHVAVIEALRAGDGTAARAAICQDIMMSTDALRQYLDGPR